MCCTVTGAHLIVGLLVAALVAMAIMAARPSRFRNGLFAGWALVPVWIALALAAIVSQNGHAADGRFLAWMFISMFEPSWLLAAAIGASLGVVLRRALQRIARHRQHHGDRHV